MIEDRINQVADEITAYLKSTDRMQKTIVFCANENHALIYTERLSLNPEDKKK